MTLLSRREAHQKNSVIQVGSIQFGGDEIIIIAGPCAIESKTQMIACAKVAKQFGAKMLRGGAFKPRSNPYNFEGLGKEGLEILKEASLEVNLPTVTEVLDIRDIDLVDKYADMFQVGARNMQNFPLLKELGKGKKPVLLKRGMSATIEELLLAAEHILAGGNPNVVLCERGIRTFERETRNTLSLSAVPLIKELSHLPIIVDPSHATGQASLVTSMSHAAIAAGADGLMLEIHTDPEEALCDGKQALLPEDFEKMMIRAKKIALAIDRHIS
ncbi:MAG: 3-deoxy-7-phosphoheptulonate synthase [Candidatus Gracilibacteria bacterium]|nr:3-deoxy-7-phosphoheptulonate synthase [Candidatus Gracilibacteria bacterium]